MSIQSELKEMLVDATPEDKKIIRKKLREYEAEARIADDLLDRNINYI
jgi:hypothetical protein